MLEASPRHIDLTVKQAAKRHAMESSTVGYVEVALELTFKKKMIGELLVKDGDKPN